MLADDVENNQLRPSKTRFFDSALFPFQLVDLEKKKSDWAFFPLLSQPFTENKDTLSSSPKTKAEAQRGDWESVQQHQSFRNHQAIVVSRLLLHLHTYMMLTVKQALVSILGCKPELLAPES